MPTDDTTDTYEEDDIDEDENAGGNDDSTNTWLHREKTTVKGKKWMS